jgi:drug/metabolite transporter (DMT)-like permease
MSLFVFLAVLAAAAVHAGWNALVKSAADKATTTVLVAAGSGLLGLVVAPFLPPPAPAAWPWLAASAVLQVVYFALMAGAYRLVDLTVAYPLMRGAAPVIVAIAGVGVFGEHPSTTGWIGVLMVGAGIGGLVFAGRGRGSLGGIALALLNALFIAGYTVTDGQGVRLSGSPIAYALWGAALAALPLVGWSLATRPAQIVAALKGRAAIGLLGGIASMVSYGVAVWAMTQAPVALVAALRETSIVFALILGRVVFRERLGWIHVAAVAVVVAGVALLRGG